MDETLMRLYSGQQFRKITTCDHHFQVIAFDVLMGGSWTQFAAFDFVTNSSNGREKFPLTTFL
jgi:hypothetical protein